MEHHVYFWLKNEFKNSTSRKEFEDAMNALFKIGHVKAGRWSVPATTSQRAVVDHSWDYALVMNFDSIAEHDAYQVDSDHDSFVAGFKDRWEKVQVMDLA